MLYHVKWEYIVWAIVRMHFSVVFFSRRRIHIPIDWKSLSISHFDGHFDSFVSLLIFLGRRTLDGFLFRMAFSIVTSNRRKKEYTSRCFVLPVIFATPLHRSHRFIRSLTEMRKTLSSVCLFLMWSTVIVNKWGSKKRHPIAARVLTIQRICHLWMNGFDIILKKPTQKLKDIDIPEDIGSIGDWASTTYGPFPTDKLKNASFVE